MINDAEGQITIVAANTIAEAEKKDKDTNIGIDFVKLWDCVTISRITAGRLIEKDGKLRMGQKVVSINGKEVKTAEEAYGLVNDTVGTLTIVAVDRVPSVEPVPGLVVVSVRKESKESSCGIGITRSIQNRVVVSTIKEDGLFANTELQVGHQIVAINNRPCPATIPEAGAIIKDAEGLVTIVALMTVATAEKPSKDTPVGLSLARTKDGIVVCKTKGGLFANSSLQKGQKLVFINGKECPEELKDAVELFKEAEGTVTIEALDVAVHLTPGKRWLLKMWKFLKCALDVSDLFSNFNQ